MFLNRKCSAQITAGHKEVVLSPHFFTAKVHKHFETSVLKKHPTSKTNAEPTAEKKILSKTQTKLTAASLAGGKKANVSMGTC